MFFSPQSLLFPASSLFLILLLVTPHPVPSPICSLSLLSSFLSSLFSLVPVNVIQNSFRLFINSTDGDIIRKLKKKKSILCYCFLYIGFMRFKRSTSYFSKRNLQIRVDISKRFRCFWSLLRSAKLIPNKPGAKYGMIIKPLIFPQTNRRTCLAKIDAMTRERPIY